jgi:hypothetical protein
MNQVKIYHHLIFVNFPKLFYFITERKLEQSDEDKKLQILWAC